MTPIHGAPIATAARMRAAEAATGEGNAALMARAGRAVGVAVRRLAGANEVLVLCGPGNNGGDGYVAAAWLAARGVAVRVAAAGEPRGEAAVQARAGWTGRVEPLAQARPAPVLLDALFGTGLTRPLEPALAADFARLAGAARLVIALDLPSGLASDDGALLGNVLGAQVTLALGAVKPAHLLQPAAARCGTVRLLDIGVPVASEDKVLPAPRLVAPGAGDHKYSRGMVALVAGAMPGAAALAAGAAAHVAGYVLLLGSATDRLAHAVVRRRWSAEALVDERIGAVVIGPGLGRDERAAEKLAAALASRHPLVIDGDALHLLSLDGVCGRAAPTILTPHEGEFGALFGELPGNKIERARAAAQAAGATLVLKGADSVVASRDGAVRVTADHVGWLASAGTGDVLAGIAGALLSRGSDPFEAAGTAVSLHVAAARAAGAAFVADDLVAALPRAIGELV